MAKNNETTTKFKVDISDLKKGIQDAQRQIRLANAEFKAASSGMDDWSKSADGISAKLKQLNTTVDAQKKVLGSLEQQYAEVVKEQGETSKGAEELKIKIANQQAAINKTEKEISKYEKALAEVDNESSDVSKSSDKAAKGIKEVSDEAKEGFENTNKLADSLAGLAKKGFTVIAGAATAAAGAFLASGEATREYREDMSKLETAFETSGHSAETAKDTYKEFYKVLGEEDRSVEAVNHLAQLTNNEKELAKWTDICAGVTATFGDSLPIEGLTEAANETAKVGKVTGPLADALNWAGISEDAFNEKLAACATEQERATLITETLNDTYDDAANKYKELNKDVMASRDAQSQLNDKMAEVGAKAEPIMAAIKQGFADVLDAALKLVEGVDFSEIATKVQEGFQYFIDEVLPKIQEGFTWIKDHSTEIVAGIAGIAGAFAALKVVGIIQGIIAATKAWIVATEGMTVAQRALNLAQKANVIGIVISLIAGLVAAFVVLWNKSEAFREFWIGLWENIKAAAGVVVTAVGEFFTNLWTNIQTVWSVVVGWFQIIWDSISAAVGALVSSVVNFFTTAWSGIQAVWSVVTGWFKNIWNGIKNVFSVVGSWFSNIFSSAWNGIKSIWNAASGFFSGIWSGIKSVFSAVGSWFGNIFSKAYNGIKNAFSGIVSFFSGIWDGIKSVFSKVGEVVGNAITNTVSKAVNGVLSTAVKIINGFISAINAAIDIINGIPGVSISKLNKLSVPAMWQGGVLKKGQIGLLEGKGDEAVVPLHNNKKWIAKTAQDMSDALKRENVIAGENKTIKNYTYNQYNNSPKALSRLEIYRQTKNQLQFAKGV